MAMAGNIPLEEGQRTHAAQGLYRGRVDDDGVEEVPDIGAQQHQAQIAQDLGTVFRHHRQDQAGQNTPMGERRRMMSMTFMQTSVRLSTSAAAGRPFSPAARMPKPNSSAATITCSMEALAKGR